MVIYSKFFIMEYCQHKSSQSLANNHQQDDFQDRIKEQFQKYEGTPFVEPSFFHQEIECEKNKRNIKRIRNTSCQIDHSLTLLKRDRKPTIRMKREISSKLPSQIIKQMRFSHCNSEHSTFIHSQKLEEENCNHLKARLHELLKNEQLETQTSQSGNFCLSNKQLSHHHRTQHSSNSAFINLAKVQSKTVLLKLNPIPYSEKPYRNINSIKNRTLKMTKFAHSFPTIDKKPNFHLEKQGIMLKTKYRHPDRNKDQVYLQPLDTVRRKKISYKLTIQCIESTKEILPAQQQSNHKSKGNILNSEKDKQKDKILAEMAKMMRFK